jgi:predicted CXXCH cytochrome family protein
MPAGPSNIGTDLSQDHPISFTYDSSLATTVGNLVDPSTLTNKVRLDHNSQMQCTSCHDPHDNQYGNFLVLPPSGSNLCSTCHITSASANAQHTISSAPLGTAAATLSPQTAKFAATSMTSSSGKSKSKLAAKTVAANGCNNCHSTHGAGNRKGLLINAREEKTCFACHNGSVDRKNLEAEFNKRSVHPVLQTSQLHQAGEDLINGPRHVACADCHNSHVAKSSTTHAAPLRNPTAAVPAATGPILQVKGVNRSGSVMSSVAYEYELCFRCHGDNATRKSATVSRVNPQANTRQQFSPSNRSFHPVVAAGKNRSVPSLISPFLPSSLIKCTDCHNNDQGPGAGGSGPNGPHGSAYAPLLERRLDTIDQNLESAASYALCYKCHSRDSILADQSFRAINSSGKSRGHDFHIREQKTACTTCHDSHGSAQNAHLINFNPEYVKPANGKIENKSTGFQSGSCTLTCHNYTHLNASYPQASLMAAPASAIRRR